MFHLLGVLSPLTGHWEATDKKAVQSHNNYPAGRPQCNIKMGDETVKVVVRARPFNSQEIKDNRKKDIEVNTALGKITITNPAPQDAMGAEPKTFSFDSVYDDDSTQRAVYDETAFPLVESVLAGYNGECQRLSISGS